MSRNSLESQSETNGFPPPPPYNSVIYKLNEQPSWENFPPPTYSDIDQFAVPNNYPGPPLTDGCVQIAPIDSSAVAPSRHVSKKLRLFLVTNGILTLFFGFAAIGLQVGLIVSNSILYYYYGFWAGALILSVAVNSLVLVHHSNKVDLTRWIRSCFWEAMLVAVVFIIGIVIITTDRCNDNGTDNNTTNSVTSTQSAACRGTNKVLMGLIVGAVGATMFQTVISVLFFRTIYQQLPHNAVAPSSS